MNRERLREIEQTLFGDDAQPSFAALLSFGLFSPSTFAQPPPREQELAERLTEQIDQLGIDGEAIDLSHSIPASLIEQLGDIGVLGLTIAEEYGGLGGSQYSSCRVVEQLARYCGSTALFANAHQSIGLKALLLFGTEQQKRQWLPQLATGEALAAFSLTEEGAGSDAAAIETRAVFDGERNVYRITGRKQWTTNGALASVLTVMARTEEGITAFLVTPQMTGFSVEEAALDKVGMRGTATSNLRFDQMEVPAENVLGKVGCGLKIALTCLDYGRTAFGASCTGAAKLCLEMATEHAQKREQFGRPLASFALIREKLARIAAYTYAMESATYFTAGLIDSGEESVMVESALVKLFSSEALWEIVYETMQIFGGRSFFCDLPLERMMRDARLNTIGEGANEVLRLFASLSGLRRVGKSAPFKAIRAQLRRPTVEVSRPELKKVAHRLEKAIQMYGRRHLTLLARHRESIVEKQLLVNRMADALISLYTVSAVLLRLDHEGVSDVGLLYCHRALDEAERQLSSLSHNRDEMVEEAAKEVIGG